MKLATFLVTCLSFNFVTAGPIPFSQDISSSKHTWPDVKRALGPWDLPGTLSKRAHEIQPSKTAELTRLPPNVASATQASASVPGRVHDSEAESSAAASARNAHGHGAGPSTPVGSIPQLWFDPAAFEAAHAKWTPEDKIRWMATSPFHWNGDAETRTFVKKSPVGRTFFWKKGTCDELGRLGCEGGAVSIKKYPHGEEHSQSHYAEVHNLQPAPYGASSLAMHAWDAEKVEHSDGHTQYWEEKDRG